MGHKRKWQASFDHVVGAGEQQLRYGEAEHPGSFEVDQELKLGRLLDGKITWFRTPENLQHIFGCTAEKIVKVDSVTNQAAGPHCLSPWVYGWQPSACRQIHKVAMVHVEHRARQNRECLCPLFDHRVERGVEVLGTAGAEQLKLC